MLWFTQIQRVSLIGILLLRIWIELLISIFNVHAIQCVYAVWMIVLWRHRKTKCDVKLAAFNLIMSLIMWKEIAFCALPVPSSCQSWMQKSRCREIIVPCIFVKNICYFTKYNSDYYSLHIWVVACYLKKLFASINWTWSIFAKKKLADYPSLFDSPFLTGTDHFAMGYKVLQELPMVTSDLLCWVHQEAYCWRIHEM